MTSTPPDPAEEPALLAQARLRDDRGAIRSFLAAADENRQRKELFRAAKEGFINVLEVFSESGMMPLDARWPSGNTTPLMHAIMKSQKAAIRFLLSKNCDIHAKNDTGYTPLHVAASSARDIETVMILALAGANFEAVNKEDKTPMEVADWKMRPEMKGWLREAEAAQKQAVEDRRIEAIERDAAIAHSGVVVKPMRPLTFKARQNNFMFMR